MPHITIKRKISQSPRTGVRDTTPQDDADQQSGQITKRHHILFLIRKHPGSVGGVQTHSASLLDSLSAEFNVDAARWMGTEWGVPFYFPVFYRRAARSGCNLIHCDDAVTALIGAAIRRGTGKKVVATVHGLDVVLPLPWYQRKLKAALMSLDRVVCVSRATADQVMKRGVDASRIVVIPNSAERSPTLIAKNDELYSTIQQFTGIDLRHKKVLLSVGRLVRRKGYNIFIERVFPHLSDDIVYIVAGPRPRTPAWIKHLTSAMGKKRGRLLLLASGCDTIHDEILRLSNHPRIFYLNNITRELRDLLFAASDLLIMPNTTIEGDMEGFGIVALEAASRGIPVIATGIEGITDAVIDGQNGYCIKEGDFAAMATLINSLLSDSVGLSSFGRKAAEFTLDRFSKDRTVGQYAALFNELLEPAQSKTLPS